MYKRILVAIDGGFYAESAASYAIDLASHCGSKLYICFIKTTSTTQQQEEAAVRSIENIKLNALERNLEVSAIIERSIPYTKETKSNLASAIKHIVAAESIDLVMTSTRRPTWEKRFFTRSLAQELMATLPCTVIAIRMAQMGVHAHLKKILMPIVGGDFFSTQRAHLASCFASAYSSKIVVLYVEQLSSRELLMLTGKSKQSLINTGVARIEVFKNALSTFGILASTKVLVGKSAKKEILEEATKHYDLLIIGATRAALINRIVLGNPVEEILRKASCNVVVWHPRTIPEEKI